MKKYLVDVYLPAAGRHYDAFLPAGKPVDEVIRLLVRILEAQPGGSGTPGSMLLDAESGKPFPMEKTVYDAGIRSASRLILI